MHCHGHSMVPEAAIIGLVSFALHMLNLKLPPTLTDACGGWEERHTHYTSPLLG